MGVGLLCLLLFSASCNSKNDKDLSASSEEMQGLVLNEICGSPGGGWIELYNPTGSDMNISGMKVLLGDDYYVGKTVYTAPEQMTIPAGAYKILSREHNDLDADIKTDEALEISLVAADGTVLDAFARNADVGNGKNHKTDGSYSRLPDGTGKWFITKSATLNEENFGITNYNAIWMWSSSAMAAPLSNLANKGIGHILLNEQFFKSYTLEQAMARIAEAENLGMTVHVWFQCFYDGNWISPVDDANRRYDQELFDAIISRAENYVRMGIKGVHFDYIRFGGTAPNHNFPEQGVTAEGAITEFCRQASEALKKINKHVILSAALMAERSGDYYYGQNPDEMGKYLDILMPMIYRYTETGSDRGSEWAKNMADYFAGRAGKAEIWAGTTTYNYVGTTVAGLDAERMKSDCRVFTGSKATGVVLFRFGLGDIADLTDLWN
jgi:hypothetical protein